MAAAPVEQIADDLKALRKAARKLETAAPREAAKQVRRAIYNELRGTPYRSRRLRNMGGARATVSYRVKGTTAVVTGKPQGVWTIIDRGAKPHQIPKRGDVRRRLAFGGRVVTGPVHHPGTAGTGAWDAGIEASLPAIDAAWAKLAAALDDGW